MDGWKDGLAVIFSFFLCFLFCFSLRSLNRIYLFACLLALGAVVVQDSTSRGEPVDWLQTRYLSFFLLAHISAHSITHSLAHSLPYLSPETDPENP